MEKGKPLVKKRSEPEEIDDLQETNSEEKFSSVGLDESLLNIDLFGQVNEKMVSVFKRYFLRLKNIYKNLPPNKREPITITINSGGGDSADGLAIFDIIRSSGLPVTTVALGVAESAGLIIFLAGNQRLIHENATLLTHKISQPDLEGNYTADELLAIARQIIVSNELYRKIILAVSKMTRRALLKLEREERSITAKEAVSCGLATEIIKNN